MHPKDADGMANSVNPDQTASSEAVWSWSALFAETYLSQYIEFVRYNNFSAYTYNNYIKPGDVSDVKIIMTLCNLTGRWLHHDAIDVVPKLAEKLRVNVLLLQL